VVLGGIIVLGLGVDGWFSKLLLVIAVIFGTINVVGGFLVTDRMLEMFKSKPAPRPEVEEGAEWVAPTSSSCSTSSPSRCSSTG
jgi:H+-translocating NAD(P) transhydrogenase subunit alpha